MRQEIEKHAADIWNNDRKFLLILSVFFLTQLYIVKTVWNQPPIWDASIYIGMGQRLFADGAFGIWEAFRPLMLPVILGTLWKIGVPMIGVPYLLSTVAVSTGLAAVYFLTKKTISRKIALYTAGIVASTTLFYGYTHMILTGIPASFLVFGAAYLAYQRDNLFAGGLNSLAFLTRFPSAIVGPGLAGYVFLRDVKDDFWKAFKNAFYYTLGFFAVATPFFLFNQHLYGNFLRPITAGASVPVQSNPETYFFGLYYLREAVLANPLLVLFPVGLGAVIYMKDWRYGSFAAALFTLYGFFTVYQHKEPRFLLLFLPLMAVFAARGLEIVEEEIVSRFDLTSENFMRAFVVVVLILTSISFSITYSQNQWTNEYRVEFLDEMDQLNGTVAGNYPVISIYGRFEYVALRPESINETYSRIKDEVDYYAFDSGAWYCTDAIPNCQSNIDGVVNEIEEQNIKKVHIEGYNRNFTVYEVPR
ncbi:glycosyltransferase family 39 protein [Candidatus Nanosalina sp. VS9-1]|uniref:glycosyltransferase family 39 protein n=1 Tax=Candidatus Nanosalina sp. VS9-1 TaxID=3388566 RepID=UPI0039E12789